MDIHLMYLFLTYLYIKYIYHFIYTIICFPYSRAVHWPTVPRQASFRPKNRYRALGRNHRK